MAIELPQRATAIRFDKVLDSGTTVPLVVEVRVDGPAEKASAPRLLLANQPAAPQLALPRASGIIEVGKGGTLVLPSEMAALGVPREAVKPRPNREEVVLKLRNPNVNGRQSGQADYGATSLACELICAAIARSIGLPVPDYYIVDVLPAFADSVPDPTVRARLRANLGPNFGCTYHRGKADWRPGLVSRATSALCEQLEDVLAFDGAVINVDRRQEKPNLLWLGTQGILLIDHSLALGVFSPIISATGGGSHEFTQQTVQRHCSYLYARRDSRRFDRVCGRWVESITEEDIDSLFDVIPLLWQRGTTDLESIRTFLLDRQGNISLVAESLIRLTA